MSRTQEATPKIEKAKLPEPETLVLELIDTKPSPYVMDGPGVDDLENVDTTAVVSFPSLRKIRNTSRVVVMVDGVPVHKLIRYIAGCPIIDLKEQEEKGYKPNHLADMIIFRNGRLQVTRSGDIAKFDYLKACEYNSEAENRPDDAQDIFKPLNTLVDAQAEEELFDLQSKAQFYLDQLKVKKEGGGFSYNEDALEFLCSLFKLPKFESGYGSEAWVELAKIARDETVRFVNSVAGVRSIIEADVFSGIQFGVITVDQQRAFFENGGKLILTFDETDNQETKENALVDFFANPKHKLFHDQLRADLRAKKDANTEVVK